MRNVMKRMFCFQFSFFKVIPFFLRFPFPFITQPVTNLTTCFSLSLCVFQTLTYLKLGMHILSAIMIGLFFGDSGINATKQISNVGMIMIHCVYLWYTTIMPGILRCK